MNLTEKVCEQLFAEDFTLEEKRTLIRIGMEYKKSCEKHPEWPADFIHAAAIVAEESGELAQAALQNTYENGPTLNPHSANEETI